MGDLFISSFLQCVQSKITASHQLLASPEDFEHFTDFLIDTEFGTQERGRIDILLHTNTHAIIIENKIYHHLANDLNDYWNTVKRDERDVKKVIGVVLSLLPVYSINHSGFVNITHTEFLTTVMSNIGSYLMQANDKFLAFLKDLYQNIENMSTATMKDEELMFYLKNQEKINELVEFNKQVFEHVKTQVVEAWNSIEDCEVIKATQNTYQWYSYREVKYRDAKNIYFAVYFAELFTSERKLWINIFVTNTYREFYDHPEIKAILNDYPKLSMDKKEQKEENWIYLAEGEYNLTEVEISNLKETIIKKIEEDQFLELFVKLEKKLSELNIKHQD